jgi:uncharacterized protein (DUF1501 family)
MQRRVFVKSGALALVTLGLNPTFLRRTAFAADLTKAGKGKILICLFQRGAADALNVVVPHADKTYYSIRPSIAIPRPASGVQDAAIDLDEHFGLHPALRSFKPLWDRKMLAPIHAVGSPSSTRSHFDAQDYMETGTPDVKGTTDGWLNRYLATHGTCEECSPKAKGSPFRAVAFSQTTPRILGGPAPSVAMNTLEEFSVRTSGTAEDRLEALYRTGTADVIHGAGVEMFDAIKMLRAADPQKYLPGNGATYPTSQFGRRLMQIAQLIKADVGLEIAFADLGGWDTHVNQGGATGTLAQRLTDFSTSIASLVTDLGDRMDDVVILTMSEFGRMARENGNRGTDHGHAGAMFVIGGSVKGQNVYGKWPGLEREQLYEGRDLALTTDFRSVFAEVASKQLGAASLEKIFPGYKGNRGDWLGLL